MLLLFVAGVMNLAWVVAIAVWVLLEKIVPRAEWLVPVAGASACSPDRRLTSTDIKTPPGSRDIDTAIGLNSHDTDSQGGRYETSTAHRLGHHDRRPAWRRGDRVGLRASQEDEPWCDRLCPDHGSGQARRLRPRTVPQGVLAHIVDSAGLFWLIQASVIANCHPLSRA
jgi:hypothetical protein